MKYKLYQKFNIPALMLFALCFGVESWAQIDTARYEAWQFSRTIPQPDYNFKAGPLYFDLTGKMSVEYDDNINYSESAPVQDLILRPSVNFRGLWEFSPLNSFSARIGIGYDKYLDNDQLDSVRLILDSESEINFSMQLGNLTLQWYDRPSYSTDPTDASFVDSAGQLQTEVSQYARFENQFGVRGFYELNLLNLDFNFLRMDEIPDDIDFDFRNKEEYLFQLRGSRALSSSLAAGVGVTYSDITYEERFLNNGNSWSTGVFVNWGPSEYIVLNGGVSWVSGDYERGGRVQDDSDSESLNFNLEIRHLLNRYYTHRLAASRRTRYGFISNSSDLVRLTYSFTYALNEWTSLEGSITYEDGEDSPSEFAEEYDRVIGTLRTAFDIGPGMRISLFGYSSNKNSSNVRRSYDKLRVGAELSYDF